MKKIYMMFFMIMIHVFLKYDGTLWVYIIEVLLVVVMLLLNLKPIKELVNLILAKFLKKRKN
mgnify:CR=1 FL=1